jgi:tRNA nucleotidyltransferase (CCA-adding enzyme)
VIRQGHEVGQILDRKPGPWAGEILSKIITWQLEHPDGTRDDCAVWLRRERDEGRIVIEASIPPGKRGQLGEVGMGGKRTKT